MAKKNQFPKSKVRARPDIKSLQATVPEGLVKQAHIRAGDSLEWLYHNGHDGEYIRVNILRKVVA